MVSDLNEHFGFCFNETILWCKSTFLKLNNFLIHNKGEIIHNFMKLSDERNELTLEKYLIETLLHFVFKKV